MSWAGLVSQSENTDTIHIELSKLKRELENTRVVISDLQKENRELRQQIQNQTLPKTVKQTNEGDSLTRTIEAIVAPMIAQITEYIKQSNDGLQLALTAQCDRIKEELKTEFREEFTKPKLTKRDKPYNRPNRDPETE